jgi:hypothetical protein
VWTLSSSLLSPYYPRYWFFEQVLLTRRLFLALVISMVPTSSIYLSLLLLTIIQLSALAQHYWARPFRNQWLNRAELVSLYLLLLNYMAAVVLQASLSVSARGGGGSGGHDQSGSFWLVVLFVLNLLFLLLLFGGLFAIVRRKVSARIVDPLRRMLGQHAEKMGSNNSNGYSKHSNFGTTTAGGAPPGRTTSGKRGATTTIPRPESQPVFYEDDEEKAAPRAPGDSVAALLHEQTQHHVAQ